MDVFQDKPDDLLENLAGLHFCTRTNTCGHPTRSRTANFGKLSNSCAVAPAARNLDPETLLLRRSTSCMHVVDLFHDTINPFVQSCKVAGGDTKAKEAEQGTIFSPMKPSTKLTAGSK